LLITDVIMPQMNGRDLAARLQERYPGLRTLYMSGYTADVIAPHGMGGEGIQFVQKPFTMQEIALKVRAALGS
jgi:DNA-binding NtrC family response regulator